MVSADDNVSSETQKRHLVSSATLYQQPMNNMKFQKVVKITLIYLLTLQWLFFSLTYFCLVVTKGNLQIFFKKSVHRLQSYIMFKAT